MLRLAASAVSFLVVTVTCARPQAQPGAETGVPVFGTTVTAAAGLHGKLYLLKRGTKKLPDFDRPPWKAAGDIWTNELNVPPQHWRAGFHNLTTRDQWFAIDYRGRFWIQSAGEYDFALLSDDGSKLFIDGQLVIDNDCLHPPDVRRRAVYLDAGIHTMHVSYFQGVRDCVALLLAVERANGNWRVFSVDDFGPPKDSGSAGTEAPAGIRLLGPPAGTDIKVADFLNTLVKSDSREASILANAPSSEGCVMAPVHNCGSK